MPEYRMRNKNTGEEIIIYTSIEGREKWLADNDDWYQPPVACGIVGNIKTSVISRTDDTWKDVLKKIKKGSSKNNTIRD